MKMISPMYLTVTIVGFMVVCWKTDALPSKGGEPHRCYQCAAPGCGARPSTLVTCPSERPYCATIAGAPNYTSSLACANVSKSPCSLTHSAKQSLELICICTTDLCNAPFSKALQEELITFSASDYPKNHTDYIEMFWKQSQLVIDNESHVYKKITMKVLATEATEAGTEAVAGNVSEMEALAQTKRVQLEREAPRAAMLIQEEATPPSDDDEDESEGEGSGAEEVGLAPRRSTPPAPYTSSRLPDDSDDSAADRPFFTVIATVPALFYLLV